ncbi:hypothetical protein HDU79_011075 [Rhizoclosmatium sp. JEL0117]|nr:hypothetical protein HDU79_011075 [Rhizoclosmatium sp. JEL0117]
MGCAPSKNATENTVVQTTLPAPVAPSMAVTPAVAQEQVRHEILQNNVQNPEVESSATAVTASSNDANVTPDSVDASSEPLSAAKDHTSATPQATPAIVEDSTVATLISVEIVRPDFTEQPLKSELEQASVLSRSVMPSIPVLDAPVRPSTAKPVAFEIPLDDDLFKPTAVAVAAAVAVASGNPVPLAGNAVVAAPAEAVNSSNNSTKLSLPKLALSNRDIMAKLANTEERWKDLERAQESRHHKRRSKPSLTSQQSAAAASAEKSDAATEDPLVLKQRLLEKEARAATRRARELLKLQTKLAKQDEHAKQVQERKKRLGKLSAEDLNLSWGGEEEDEETKKKLYGQKLQDAVGIDGLMKMKLARKEELLDNDSGKGSSAASVSNGSRSGSGRSLGFAEDGTEIIESI